MLDLEDVADGSTLLLELVDEIKGRTRPSLEIRGFLPTGEVYQPSSRSAKLPGVGFVLPAFL